MRIFKTFHNFLLDVLLLFIASLTPLIWFRGNNVITGFDSGYPINPLVHFLDRLFVWSNRFGFGQDRSMDVGGFFIHGQEAIFQALGLSLQAEQKIIFISWFFLIGFSTYIFTRTIFNKKYRYAPLIAAFFMMFNTYTTQSWPVVERAKFSVILATPLIATLLIQFFRDKLSWLQTALIISLVLFIFNADGANGLPLNAGMVIFNLCIYIALVVNAYYNKKETISDLLSRRVIKFGLVLLGSFLCLDAYWLLPFWNFAHKVVSSGAISVQGLLDWLRVVSASASLPNLLRMQGEPGWYELHTSHPFGPLYLTNIGLIIMSFLWPALVLSSYLWEKKKSVLVLIGIALVGIFFTAGAHVPTGALFEFLFTHIPGFFLIRSAWFKFNYVISLSYAVIIGYSIHLLYKKISDKNKMLSYVFLVGFFVYLGIYNFPYFGIKMFEWNNPLTLMVHIPSYVNDFDTWVNKLPEDKRLAIFPPLNKQWDGVAYTWGYYSFGTPPTTLLTNRTTYTSSSYLSDDQQAILNSLYTSVLQNDESTFTKLTHLLGLSYVVVQDDVYTNLSWIPAPDPKLFEKNLQSFSDVSTEKKFGAWHVYSLKGSNFSPISFPTKITATNLSPQDYIENMQSPNQIYKNLFVSLPDNNTIQANDYFLQGNCVSCSVEKSVFSLPPSSILPSSFLYKFTVAKSNQKSLAALGKSSTEAQVDGYIGLGLKRLSEIQQVAFQPKESAFVESFQNLNLYVNNLKDIVNQTHFSVSTLGIEERLTDFIQFADRMINAYQGQGVYAPNYKNSLSLLQGKLADLENLIQRKTILKDTFTSQAYTLWVPKNGNYTPSDATELFMKDQIPMDGLSVELDGQKITMGEKIFLDKGNHVLTSTYTLPPVQIYNSSSVLSISNTNENGQEIFGFHPQQGLYYRISFDYAVNAHSVMAAPVLKKDSGSGSPVAYDALYLKEMDAKWHTSSIILKPTQDIQKIILKTPYLPIDSTDTAQIKNVRIEEVPGDLHVLFASDQLNYQLSSPAGVFKRINQTRYDMVVNTVPHDDFYITFADSFDAGWKVSVDNVVLPESRHMRANGYANTWLIKKTDFRKFPPHEIAVYYAPQSIFDAGVMISITSLTVVLLLLVVSFLPKEEYGKIS